MEERLPARARSRIFALRDEEQQAQTVLNVTQRQVGELNKAHDISSDSKHQMELRDESERLQATLSDKQLRHRQLADLNRRIVRFLDTLPTDATLEPVKPIRIKVNTDVSFHTVVGELRVKIIELIGERSSVERAGLAIDEVKAQILKFVQQRSMQAQPNMIANHDKFSISYTYMDPAGFTPALDPLALLCWLYPDDVAAKLCEMAASMPQSAKVMTPLEKATRLREIKTELEELERLEVTWLDAASEVGVIIPYRETVDVCALLGVTVQRKSKKAA